MARSGPRLTQSQFLQCLFEITLIDVLFRIRQRAFYAFLLGVNIHHRFEPVDFDLKLRMPCLVGQVIIESFRRQFGAKLKFFREEFKRRRSILFEPFLGLHNSREELNPYYL